MNIFGIAIGLLSAVFNGTFCVPAKIQSVKNTNVHAIVFNLYVCFGIFLGSFAVFPFLQYNPMVIEDSSSVFRFSFYGLLSGILLVASNAFAFSAIRHIGLSVSQGAWSGIATIVSFFWGAYVFHDVPFHPWIASGALFFLIIGIVGIALSEKLALSLKSKSELITLRVKHKHQQLTLPKDERETDKCQDLNRRNGYLYAALVGIFGGSILVPMHYSEKNVQGLVFIPSFGIGTLFCGLIFTTFYFVFKKEMPSLYLADTFFPGVLSGVLWSMSNLCSVIAIAKVGYAIGYTLMQCGIFVSCLWGYYFLEIQGPAIRYFACSGLIMFFGVILLAYSSQV